jgi:alpha-L-fucosidase
MGEDVRWVGTETGYGRETEWSATVMAPGGTPESTAINKALGIDAMSADLGSSNLLSKAEHLFWYPAEVDVSIRPGWFWHASEDSLVKDVSKLADIYLSSVGRNSVLLLNVPPDNRGLITEHDIRSLQGLRAWIDNLYAVDLLNGARPYGQGTHPTSLTMTTQPHGPPPQPVASFVSLP